MYNYPAVPGIDTLPTMYDRYSNQFRIFCLQANRYVELTVSGQGFWFEELELGLGIWVGAYFGVEGQWLRWYDRSGAWIGTDREQLIQAQQGADQATQRADKASQRADEAIQRADRERERADLLAAKLKDLGIDLE